MEDRIGVFPRSSQFLEGLGRRENHQLDASPLGFLGDVLHHRERPVGSAADDQTLAAPGDVLGAGDRR
jgi:hypothetical protein